MMRNYIRTTKREKHYLKETLQEVLGNIGSLTVFRTAVEYKTICPFQTEEGIGKPDSEVQYCNSRRKRTEAWSELENCGEIGFRPKSKRRY
ncbi:hypothetical protein ANN_16399 [Periplaneta americana]|uniref:Uncharacterized protein n=1 Tax=Periplaneta americana TaxID=6978 RepID=A0ABQ8SIV7_PERAM|nr:hypothetical protein ANN_16399 [Periplaneta americana]